MLMPSRYQHSLRQPAWCRQTSGKSCYPPPLLYRSIRSVALFECGIRPDVHERFLLCRHHEQPDLHGYVVFTFHFWWVVNNVVSTTRSQVSTTARHTLNDHIISNVEFNHVIHVYAHLFQAVCLWIVRGSHPVGNPVCNLLQQYAL